MPSVRSQTTHTPRHIYTHRAHTHIHTHTRTSHHTNTPNHTHTHLHKHTYTHGLTHTNRTFYSPTYKDKWACTQKGRIDMLEYLGGEQLPWLGLLPPKFPVFTPKVAPANNCEENDPARRTLAVQEVDPHGVDAYRGIGL